MLIENKYQQPESHTAEGRWKIAKLRLLLNFFWENLSWFIAKRIELSLHSLSTFTRHQSTVSMCCFEALTLRLVKNKQKKQYNLQQRTTAIPLWFKTRRHDNKAKRILWTNYSHLPELALYPYIRVLHLAVHFPLQSNGRQPEYRAGKGYTSLNI